MSAETIFTKLLSVGDVVSAMNPLAMIKGKMTFD